MYPWLMESHPAIPGPIPQTWKDHKSIWGMGQNSCVFKKRNHYLNWSYNFKYMLKADILVRQFLFPSCFVTKSVPSNLDLSSCEASLALVLYQSDVQRCSCRFGKTGPFRVVNITFLWWYITWFSPQFSLLLPPQICFLPPKKLTFISTSGEKSWENDYFPVFWVPGYILVRGISLHGKAHDISEQLPPAPCPGGTTWQDLTETVHQGDPNWKKPVQIRYNYFLRILKMRHDFHMATQVFSCWFAKIWSPWRFSNSWKGQGDREIPYYILIGSIRMVYLSNTIKINHVGYSRVKYTIWILWEIGWPFHNPCIASFPLKHQPWICR